MNRNISTVSKTHTQAHSLSFRMRDIPKAIPNKLKVKRSSNYLCIESEISFSYFTYFCHDFIYVSLWYSWDCLNWIQSFSFCFFSEEKQNYFERKFNRPHLTNRLWKGKKKKKCAIENWFGSKYIICMSLWADLKKLFNKSAKDSLFMTMTHSLTIFAPCRVCFFSLAKVSGLKCIKLNTI